jgi:hypothetical protein
MTWIAVEWREKGGLRRRLLEVRRLKGRKKPNLVRYLKPGRASLKLAVGRHTRLKKLIRKPQFKTSNPRRLKPPSRLHLKGDTLMALENMEAPEVQPPQPPKPRKRKKIALTILAIFIILKG